MNKLEINNLSYIDEAQGSLIHHFENESHVNSETPAHWEKQPSMTAGARTTYHHDNWAAK